MHLVELFKVSKCEVSGYSLKGASLYNQKQFEGKVLWLKAFTHLRSSVPSTYLDGLQTPVTPPPDESLSLVSVGKCSHIPTKRHTHLHIKV